MRELTAYEMEDVSGTWGPPGMIFGAVMGAAGYLGNSVTSGSFTFKGLAGHTVAGGVAGAVLGPVGAAYAARGAYYFGPRVAFAGGMFNGCINH